MENWIIAILFFLLAIPVTIVITRYFHKRATGKSLSAQIISSARVFEGVDDEVARSLQVHYQGRVVPDLHQVDLRIGNSGDRAISNCIRPLALIMDGRCGVLDIAVVDVDPDGREVTVSWSASTESVTAEFRFDLLNHGESFLCRILAERQIDTSTLELVITAEDLPPVLEIQEMNGQKEQDPRKELGVRVNGFALLFSLFVAIPSQLSGILLLRSANIEEVVSNLPVWQAMGVTLSHTPGTLLLLASTLLLSGLIFTILGAIVATDLAKELVKLVKKF